METIELLEQLKREKVSDPEKKTIILERYLKTRRTIGYNLTLRVLRGVGFDFGVSLLPSAT